MTFPLAVLLVAVLAVASTAGAACLTCIGDGTSDDGYCQPSNNGRCSYTCCLWDEGTPCSVLERTYGCAPDDPAIVPASYFATKLPLVVEGSALRLRLGKGLPVPKKCGGAQLARMKS